MEEKLTQTTESRNFQRPTISVVIVNYNVRDYLAQALLSLQKALAGIPHEIFVVDNASVDGSVAYIRKHFPEVKLIVNKENVGFARANNQALRLVQGEFVVIINPDTVVQEDTFTTLLEFFRSHPDASAATCKIINPDGSFSVDCRHSIPTPSIAFWKVTGLSRLFPKSRIFGQYNLTYLDPNEIYTVPGISGSFMMIRKEVLDKVGLFDERFFMYCEDIDLCHRINENGFKIYYVPTTQIIHYKGESTKKDNLDYVITFNKALYQFFQKYYAARSIFLFRWLITLGIFLRGIVIYLRNFLKNHFPLLLDISLLNIMILVAFIVRFQLKRGFRWEDFFHWYGVVNLIATVLFLGISFYLDIYPHHRFSMQSILKANIITFVLLGFLTFFLKQFAFSRMVVLFAFVLSPISMLLWRAALRRYYRGDKAALGKDLFSKPTVIVGNGEDVKLVYRKLRARMDIDYEIVGWVSQDEFAPDSLNGELQHLGTLSQLDRIIRFYRIRQVVFSAHSVSYEQILKTMSDVRNPLVEFKMVPSNLEVIIGKSHIERLDDYPLLDIDYSLGKPFNRLVKRLMDVAVALVGLILFLPYALVCRIFCSQHLEIVEYQTRRGGKIRFRQFRNLGENNPANLWFKLWAVLSGKLSLVGFPLEKGELSRFQEHYWYKPGLTGLVQLNRDKIYQPDDAEKYHLFYMKNQSLLLDLEILFKSLFQRRKRNTKI